MRSERGGVLLLSTVIMAVLISIITAGLARGLSGEARQTVDANSSQNAYYAAEAGVEDALQRIKDHTNQPSDPYYYTETDGRDRNNNLILGPRFKQVGPNGQESPDDPGSTWIHRTIQLTSQTVGADAYLKKDAVTQIDPGHSGIATLVIDWDNPEQGDTSKTPTTPLPSGCPTSGWLTTFPAHWGTCLEPAALELTRVSWDNARLITSFDPVKKYLARACNSNAACGAPETGTVKYTPELAYHFRWVVPVDQNRVNVFRIRSWYAGTHYRVTALDQNGNLVEIPDQYITIDVTGKSGDSYRRLVVKKKYQADIFSIFDFVLSSETDLCKNFSVYANPLQPDSTFCN